MALVNLFSFALRSPVFLLLSAVGLPVVYYLWKRRLPDHAPAFDREGWPLVGPLRFWTDRKQYMADAGARSSTGNWSFWAGQTLVVGVSGESGLRAFFEARGLDIGEGFRTLFAGSVAAGFDERDPNIKKDYDSYFLSRVALMLRPDKLSKSLPTFRGDVLEQFNALPSEGSFDPFELIYRLAWRLAVRMVGPEDIANDPVKLNECLDLFDRMDESYSPFQILFPRIWHPKRKIRDEAGLRIFTMFATVAKTREATGEKKDDAFQILLDQGDYLQNMLSFVLGVLYAAQFNTGINAACVLSYLGANAQWQQRVREEVTVTARAHAKDPKAPLADQLADIPLEVWENGFPILYACEKDSLRLQTIGGFFRKNITDRAVPITEADGSVREYIPPGACVAFNYAHMHADPSLYPDPQTWDPARYLPDTDASKAQGFHGVKYAEIHWGAGRHVCGGMRFAKLEMNMICAHFVALFDWDLTDDSGEALSDVESDFSRWATSKPSRPHRIRYRRRANI